MTVIEAGGIALLVIQVVLALPLMRTVVRARSVTGFAVLSEAVWAVTGLGWAAYGGLTGSTVLFVSGSIAALTSGTLVTLAYRWGSRLAALELAGTGAVAMLVCVAFWWGGPVALGGVLAAVGIVQFLPQVRVSLTALRQGIQTPGVSVIASGLRSVYALGWATFGALRPVENLVGGLDWPLVVWGVSGAVAYAIQGLAARRTT